MLFVGTSIIHPSTEGVFLLCNILDLLIYSLFEESWAKKDYETAFRAMHTLKGVAVNLGFTALYNVSSALTEKLRSQEYDNLDGLIADVKKQYDIVIEAIAALG